MKVVFDEKKIVTIGKRQRFERGDASLNGLKQAPDTYISILTDSRTIVGTTVIAEHLADALALQRRLANGRAALDSRGVVTSGGNFSGFVAVNAADDRVERFDGSAGFFDQDGERVCRVYFDAGHPSAALTFVLAVVDLARKSFL